MKFRISSDDKKSTKLLKLCYLIPFCIIAYIPSVIYLGAIEVGNPYSEMKEILEEIFE